ncbi:uridine kinase [Acidobacteria bacterium ACD]|nr:MAG: uridine kinase [Acidobacteriota bacterium]MCE7959612.1 uridine kinase [Acidobacteria bacterium ACB2]MDL1950617.1 uridine kinase [Acidobacteria bacterium ACD]
MTPTVIGVAGGTGSGKTTVAHAIVRRIGADRIAILSHDWYYRDWADLPLDVLDHRNFDHPDSLQTELLVGHLAALKAGRAVEAPVYDFKTHRRAPEPQRVEPRRVILVDGILIFVEPALRQLFDVKIFVDTDADVRLIRRIRRDTAERGRSLTSVLEQYESTVRPMHLEFVEPSKRWADLIIPEGGENVVALEFLFARLEKLLHP